MSKYILTFMIKIILIIFVWKELFFD